MADISELIRRALGGRPMTLLTYAFTDVVSGRDVFYWEDQLGRFWLAEGPWSLFRVPTEKTSVDFNVAVLAALRAREASHE